MEGFVRSIGNTMAITLAFVSHRAHSTRSPAPTSLGQQIKIYLNWPMEELTFGARGRGSRIQSNEIIQMGPL